MGLRDLTDLKRTYSSDGDNLLKQFYNPVLETAVSYDRTTGYFSPMVLAAASRGFSMAIKNGVKIRLVTSVAVSDLIQFADKTQLDIGDLEGLGEFSTDEIKSSLEKDYLKVFAYLLKTGQLEVKIAVMKKEGIYHQKVGIVTDANGDSISFSGSNNETVYGWNKNDEQFKVFMNWEPDSVEWYNDDKENFNKYWFDYAKNCKVLPISDAVKQDLILKNTDPVDDIETIVERIKEKELKAATEIPKIEPEPFERPTPVKPPLHYYQEDAIEHWFQNNCVSIFAMATGTGKTYTTVNALEKFKKEKGYIRAIVAAPLKTLAVQWSKDVELLFPQKHA